MDSRGQRLRPILALLGSLALAFAEILLLGAALVATILGFSNAHRFAAVLLTLYLGWITFAAALSFALGRLNPAG